VLGVPFYTRIWTEEEKDGKLSVTSQAVSMDKTRRLIAEKGLKPVYSGETGQNYVEFKEGDKTMKIWLEDETSMKARVELVKKYNLAGIASWRRGYEIPEIWETIRQTLGGP
jgi:spore germination protein YaaH